MKILTLTTYQGYNYGASLQAYALQQYLRCKGHNAELIRFEPEYLMRYYDFWYVNPDSRLSKNTLSRMLYRILKWVHRSSTLRRKKLFDEFNHHILYETEKVWKSGRELKENPPHADLFIVGSDQVWNVLYEGGRDPAFYLDFVCKGRRASYAASFSFLDIPQSELERISAFLQLFDGISVREYQGKELLKNMSVESTWVLDPTFLLPVSSWDSLVDQTPKAYTPVFFNQPYLLVYDFESNMELKTFSIKYAKERGLKIYSIVDRFPLGYADKNFKNAGPVDFIRMIKNCECFVSNSFHGTVFSIIYHKPFFVFSRQKAKVNSRLESLLAMFGLENRLIDGELHVNDMPNNIDWSRVDMQKAYFLNISEAYLKKLGV